jgi:DNA polymerase III alpha subunit
VAEKNNIGQSILTERNIIELIYQNKTQHIKNCVISQNESLQKYNNLVSENKDPIEIFQTIIDDQDGQDLYDQNNRLNWFMPAEYKQFDIEDYILGLCNTPEQKQRVEQELNLYKSHAMMDVLQFLKYMVDTLRKNNIVWGVGRGSSVASYVLYLLGVHKVDSIKYNLDPTEFMR